MEKRRLISLRSVLLQYLVRTALACLLVAVGWLLVLLLWIQNSGLFLPANQAAQACQKASSPQNFSMAFSAGFSSPSRVSTARTA